MPAPLPPAIRVSLLHEEEPREGDAAPAAARRTERAPGASRAATPPAPEVARAPAPVPSPPPPPAPPREPRPPAAPPRARAGPPPAPAPAAHDAPEEAGPAHAAGPPERDPEAAALPAAGEGAPSEGGELAARAPSGPETAAADADRVWGEHEVDRVAAPAGGLRPRYPPRERMLGREGVVELRVTVGADGRPRDVEVTRSAGEAFDAAARAAAEAARFHPARRGGRDVASHVTLRVRFALR